MVRIVRIRKNGESMKEGSKAMAEQAKSKTRRKVQEKKLWSWPWPRSCVRGPRTRQSLASALLVPYRLVDGTKAGRSWCVGQARLLPKFK